MKLYGRQKEFETQEPPAFPFSSATAEMSPGNINRLINTNRRLASTLQETRIDNAALRLVAAGKS